MRQTAKGWRDYLNNLAKVAGTEEAGVIRNAWAVGSQAWRQNLAQSHGAKTGYAALTQPQRRELKETQWEALVVELLPTAGRNESDLETGLKFPNWKLTMATLVKDKLGADSRRLARIKMGKASSLRVYLSKMPSKN